MLPRTVCAHFRFWGGLLFASVALALTCLSPAAGADSGSLEYPIKATYIYKFVPFIEWPYRAFPSSSSPLVLCVAGEDPFGDLLDRVVAGQQVGERPIVVMRSATARRDGGCHIMYIGGSSAQSIEAALREMDGAPVLTVTDSARSETAKGIVHFVVQERRVRFQIDDAAAARSDIRISSKLLNLAVSIRPRAEEPRRNVACASC